MKPAIPIAAAFVVGLAASTLVGMRHPAAAAAETPAKEATVAEAPAKSAPTDSTGVVAPPDSATAPADTTHAGDSTMVATRRVVAVFAKLSPEDVAPLAAGMSDSVLAPVLASLGPARAAAILAALPATRAKTLSRQMLVPTRAGSKP
jgi:hypothetical protein